MYAIFTQGRDGMRWNAVATTAKDAVAQIAAGDFDGDDVDFVFALPGVVGFRDLDGNRESTPAPAPDLLE